MLRVRLQTELVDTAYVELNTTPKLRRQTDRVLADQQAEHHMPRPRRDHPSLLLVQHETMCPDDFGDISDKGYSTFPAKSLPVEKTRSSEYRV
jgi:hypothetical protein